MFIKSQITNQAVSDSFITALYTQKKQGKYTLVAQIDTDKAHLPSSFSSMPIQTAETEAEAAELLRVMVESLNRKL